MGPSSNPLEKKGGGGKFLRGKKDQKRRKKRMCEEGGGFPMAPRKEEKNWVRGRRGGRLGRGKGGEKKTILSHREAKRSSKLEGKKRKGEAV